MNKQIWAVQVTDTNISAILVSKTADSYEIIRSNYYDLESGTISLGKIVDKNKLIEKLKLIKKENKIGGSIVLSISESLSLSKGIETPILKKNEFEQYVKNEFSNFAVYSKKDFFFDYKEFSLTNDKKFNYVISLAKEDCLEYLRIFKKAGLKVIFIADSTESIFEALPFLTKGEAMDSFVENGPYGIAIISDSTTKVSIFNKDNMIAHNSIDMGLNDLNEEEIPIFTTRINSILDFVKTESGEVKNILVAFEKEIDDILLNKIADSLNKKVYYIKKNNSFSIVIALSSAINVLENKNSINILKRHYENKASNTNRAISLSLIFLLFNSLFFFSLAPTLKEIRNLNTSLKKVESDITLEENTLKDLNAKLAELNSLKGDNLYFESVKALKNDAFNDIKIESIYKAIPAGVTVNKLLLRDKILGFSGETSNYNLIKSTLDSLLKNSLISSGKIIDISRSSSNSFIFNINFYLK